MAGVLGKLFGKKEEEDDFLSYDKTMPGAGVPGPAGFGAPGGDLGMPGALPNVGGGVSGALAQKDIELITSKLDSLKITLDTIQQRLANVEAKLAQQTQQQQPAPQQAQQPANFGYADQQQPQQQQQPHESWHF